MHRSVDDFMTAGGVAAALQGGCTLQTGVYDPDKTSAAGPIYLEEGDELCGECGDLITNNDYPGANYANLLATLKLKYGTTYCAECHDRVCLSESGEEGEHGRATEV